MSHPDCATGSSQVVHVPVTCSYHPLDRAGANAVRLTLCVVSVLVVLLLLVLCLLLPTTPPQEPAAAVDSQGRRHSASLHPSSQAAQPTESYSQSGRYRACLCTCPVLAGVDSEGTRHLHASASIYMRTTISFQTGFPGKQHDRARHVVSGAISSAVSLNDVGIRRSTRCSTCAAARQGHTGRHHPKQHERVCVPSFWYGCICHIAKVMSCVGQ